MLNIAIDGPAGVGKSTTAKAVAAKLGLTYVDTGALYRAIGVYVLDLGRSTEDADAVRASLDGLEVTLAFVDGAQRVYVNGEDVTGRIRTPAASKASSDVSAVPEVREFLLETQRRIARENPCIMDGRDIGTVILPDAKPKFFLTASPEERARRRTLELEQKGTPCDYETVLAEMIQRDRNDSTRAVAPLKPAPDAIMVDSSDMSLEEVVDFIVAEIEKAQ